MNFKYLQKYPFHFDLSPPRRRPRSPSEADRRAAAVAYAAALEVLG